MSALLDVLAEARELRDAARHEFERAVIRASEEGRHSLRQIAGAAGVSVMGVRYILNKHRERSAK